MGDGVMRTLSIVEIILGVSGMLAIGGGLKLDNPLLLYGGFVLFGGMFLVGGIDAVLTRELSWTSRRAPTRRLRYEGAPAVLFGLTSVIVGLWVSGFGAISLMGLGSAAAESLLRRPGLLLLSLGAALVCAGAASIGGSKDANRSTADLLMSLPSRFGGLIFVLLGAGAVLAGLMEIAAPGTFDAAMFSTFGELLPTTMR